MRNLKLVIAYDGTNFRGWQRQPHGPTVQGTLESALAKMTGHELQVHGSGRTDAGAHAAAQVANFKTECPFPAPNLLRALNNLLPGSIRVREVAEVADSFHARHSARAKTYRYRILQAPVALPFISPFVYHYPYPLDRKRMAEAARWVEGEHDFTSFAAAKDLSDSDRENFPGSAVRRIYSSRFLWRPKLQMLVYEIRGSGFLHHMVRNLVGTLIEVGRGKLQPRDMLRIFEAQDRSQAGPTAPASGLFLVNVEY
ncbi:MAG: tRNA pseudouridine(38-40) synthase TruA [Acidobacteria bacterium]|nr:MAG: tRNA pseudouridine(38-40) synthase TruA [Acidobacteriota bacterium]